MNPFLLLLLTIIIECLIYVIVIRKKIGLLLGYCFLINSATWPLATLFYEIFGLFWVIEIGVFAVECVLIKYLIEISWKKAIIISLIANSVTALLGVVISHIRL